MSSWYKAKDSYKSIPEEESYFIIAPQKHGMLMNGEAVQISPRPQLLVGVDFTDHLEKCDAPPIPPVKAPPKVEEVATPEKSAEPSDGWTKDELKSYMDDNEIEYNSGDTKSDLLDKIEGGS